MTGKLSDLETVVLVLQVLEVPFQSLNLTGTDLVVAVLCVAGLVLLHLLK